MTGFSPRNALESSHRRRDQLHIRLIHGRTGPKGVFSQSRHLRSSTRFDGPSDVLDDLSVGLLAREGLSSLQMRLSSVDTRVRELASIVDQRFSAGKASGWIPFGSRSNITAVLSLYHFVAPSCNQRTPVHKMASTERSYQGHLCENDPDDGRRHTTFHTTILH